MSTKEDWRGAMGWPTEFGLELVGAVDLVV